MDIKLIKEGIHTGEHTHSTLSIILLFLKNMQYYHTPLFACFAEIHIIYSVFREKLNC